MPPTVVILGRPNVGKSTLFNRLAGRRIAIVDNTPGVTRDRKEAPARIGGREVLLVDTAGLEEAAPETVQGRMRASSACSTGSAAPIASGGSAGAHGSRATATPVMPPKEPPRSIAKPRSRTSRTCGSNSATAVMLPGVSAG